MLEHISTGSSMLCISTLKCNYIKFISSFNNRLTDVTDLAFVNYNLKIAL